VGYFIPWISFYINFDKKNGLGYILGDFSQTDLVTLPREGKNFFSRQKQGIDKAPYFTAKCVFFLICPPFTNYRHPHH
jgi:hypothetical protein